jgi:hypothetical protein
MSPYTQEASMKKVPSEYAIILAFESALEQEELLLRKYDEYLEVLESDNLKDMLREFRKYAQEHVKLIHDKVVHLNLQH